MLVRVAFGLPERAACSASARSISVAPPRGGSVGGRLSSWCILPDRSPPGNPLFHSDFTHPTAHALPHPHDQPSPNPRAHSIHDKKSVQKHLAFRQRLVSIFVPMQLGPPILHSAQRTAHSAQRTAHSAQRTAHSAQRTAHSAQRTAHVAARGLSVWAFFKSAIIFPHEKGSLPRPQGALPQPEGFAS